MRRQTHRLHVVILPQDRALKKYLLRIEKLLNANEDRIYDVKLQVREYSATKLIKNGHLVQYGDDLLAAQEYASAGTDEFRDDVLQAHGLREDVHILFCRLPIGFWEWILMHRADPSATSLVPRMVKEQFCVLDDLNDMQTIDKILTQLSWEDVCNAISRYAIRGLDKRKTDDDDDTFREITVVELLGVLTDLAGLPRAYTHEP